MTGVLTKSTVVGVSRDISGSNYRRLPTQRVFPRAPLGSQEKEGDANLLRKVNERETPCR